VHQMLALQVLGLYQCWRKAGSPIRASTGIGNEKLRCEWRGIRADKESSMDSVAFSGGWY
jgi:hypothetical protein